MQQTNSNNLSLPLQTRVKNRLQELKELGKPRFYKDENKEWHDVLPETPISGPLDWYSAVVKNGDQYVVKYDLFKTDKKGLPVEVLVGDKLSGQTVKVIEYRVKETFEKGKEFTTKKDKVDNSERFATDTVPGEVSED